jgi:hypothetical protein
VLDALTGDKVTDPETDEPRDVSVELVEDEDKCRVSSADYPKAVCHFMTGTQPSRHSLSCVHHGNEGFRLVYLGVVANEPGHLWKYHSHKQLLKNNDCTCQNFLLSRLVQRQA